jgi:3-hydroxybutyryl-CoA dehydrogenase
VARLPDAPVGSKGTLAVKLVQSLNGAGSAAELSPLIREQTWEWPAGSRVDQPEIGQVGVVGLGATGAALAELCLRAGVETVGCELSTSVAERARARIERSLYWEDEEGAAKINGRPPIARLTLTGELSRLAECEVVFECAGEQGSAKRELIAELDATIRRDAVIASHTLRLSVTEVSASADRPQRVVGLHLPNQTGGSPLVEVVRGELTEAGAVESVAAFMKRLGRHPVCCQDTPGLIVDRVLIPLLNDCVRVLDEADVTPEDLDAGLRLGAGWSLGPCALLDSIGIDVHVAAAEALYAALREPRMAPPARLVRMRRAGLLGRKAGQGFYSYSDVPGRAVARSDELV